MFFKSLLLFGAVGILTAGGTSQTHAQETQSCGDRELVKAGTFRATGKTVGILIGARWGSGTVTLNNGESFRFTFEGGKLLDIGISKTDIFGVVYNLSKKEDFFGTYLGVGGGLAISTKAMGGVSFTNGKCVVVNGKAVGKSGVRLTNPLGPGGVIVRAAN